MKSKIFLLLLFLFTSFCVKSQAGIITNHSFISSNTVGMYDKFELGLLFSKIYQNPYDIDYVSLECDFYSPLRKQNKFYGFFREYFKRDNVPPFWTKFNTRYNWRVKFYPSTIKFIVC